MLLVAKCRAITSMSSRSAVSMPTLMPALAITTSGRPCAAMQAWPAATMLSGRHVGAVDRQRSASRPWPAPRRFDFAVAPRHQRQPPARLA
jgi:hypothetical protein